MNENLPEHKKKRLEKLKDKKKDIVILAEVELEDTVEKAEEQFEQYDCVIEASHDIYFEADGTVKDESGVSVTTNDPDFTNDKQWHLKATNVPQAWKYLNSIKNPYQVWIAVIDSGVQMNHPDLKNVLMRDLSVDVTQGNKRLVNCTDAKNSTGQYTNAHGTAVTGVIAAEAGNGKMGAGAASLGALGNFAKIKNSH